MKVPLPNLFTLAFGLMMLFATNIRGQDTLAYYPFSGNVQDASAFGNDATVNGAGLTQDRFGVANSAVEFNGEQDFLLASDAGHLNTGFTTLAFWIRVDSLPPQGEVFLLSHGGWQERWKISLPGHGKPVFTTNSTSGISDMDSGDGNELQTGVWAHVAMVHDGTDDKIFVNGNLANSKPVAGELNSTTYPLGMGFDPIGGALFFKGALDEVMIFDAALPDQAIADLYTDQSTPPSFDQGLVAAYPFSNNTLDASGFGNHASSTAVTPATDRFGFGYSAYDFNGMNSSVTADNSAQLNSDFTSISFWVKVDELPAQGEYYLLSHGGWQERWKISLPGHGKPVFTTNSSSGISDMDSGDGNELQPGVWSHVVMTHDGAEDRIYIDGALTNSKAVAGELNATVHPFGIGYNPIDNANYSDGALDEVQLYNYALSEQEVSDLYNAQSTSGAAPTDLVAAYPFSGNANDTSIYENHAWVGGAELTADRFGFGANAYLFNQEDSLLAANSVALNSDFATVSFWVKVNTLPAQGEAFLLSNGGWQERWKISLPGHGKPVFTTNSTSGISDMDSGDGNELQPGVWAHVAMVHDGTDDKIFVNGTLANSKAVAGALNSTSHPLGIGNNPIDGGSYFDGSLDDILIYNRALSDQEIADLFNTQSVEPAIDQELVAYYPFSGNADDVTPFTNNAEVRGPQLAGDRFERANMAYAFDGTDDEISAANSPQLNSDFTTVSFWVLLDELPAQGEYYLLSFGGWQERWKISLPGHGKPVWTTNATSGISDMDSGDGNELPVDSWTHVAMTHDGAADKIYINGALVAEKAVTGELNSTTNPLGMGYNPIDGGSFLNGSLDEVQIYNRALSDQEIADLFAAQAQAPDEDDATAPTAPLNLTAEVTFNNVELNWQASTDNVSVVAYNVFQDSVKIATTENTTLSLLELAPLTEFLFGVTAVDAAGNESTMTTLTVMTDAESTPDVTPPTAPGNLRGDAGSSSVVLSWEPSVDDRQVAGYVVLVDGILFDTLGGNSTSVFISGLESETLYSFEVYAFDGAGNDSEIALITLQTEQELDTGEPGLVAWYPFEGDANDATPYNNHGVIGGDPVFETVENRIQSGGMAIKFDGDQDSVLAPNAVQLISDFTSVSFWIRVDDRDLTAAEAYILDFGHWDQRWKISLPQHLKIVWTTNSKNNQFDNFISDMDSGDGNELVEGFWWYVTMVHDGEDDIIYVDGVEVNRVPASGTLNSTDRPLGMGSNPIDGGQYFNGALDEVKIYNKALTSEEAANLYSTGTTGFADNLSADLRGTVKIAYPIPATDELIIEHTLDGRQPLLLRVFDLSGRQVDAIRYNRNELPGEQLSVDVSSYPQGAYFLNFVWGGKNLGALKFFKQ